MILYNIGILLYGFIIAIVAAWNSKAKLWRGGRKAIFDRMREVIPSAQERQSGDDNGEIVWFHVASLGEFEQGRPLIEALRRESPKTKILLTFFSPSGYEVRKNYQGADYIFYLPLDTPSNVKKFLDIASPNRAIFVKYEYWLNMLFELNRRSIETYVVSATFRQNSIFFKPWGTLHRKALSTFKTIFVQTAQSKELLSTIGVCNVEIAGDTRFDRVIEIAKSVTPVEKIAEFASGEKLLVVGSSWAADIEIVLPLIKGHKERKYLIVPHEVDAAHMSILKEQLEAQGVDYSLYSNYCTGESASVMVVDTIGVLSKAYQYAKYAYIGGGFGVGIHNTLEAAVYGIPIAFGPNYKRFTEAVELINRGVAHSVADYTELEEWFSSLESAPSTIEQTKLSANKYIAEQGGASMKILSKISTLE